MKKQLFTFCLLLSSMLVVAQPAQFINFDKDSLGDVTDYLQISPTEYWIAASNGIGHYTNGGNNVAYFYRNQSPIQGHEFTAIAKIGVDIWVGNKQGQVHKYNGTNWNTFNLNEEIADIKENANAQVLVLTNQNLYELNGGTFIANGPGGTSLFVHNSTLYVSDFLNQSPGQYNSGSGWVSLPAGGSIGLNKAYQLAVTPDGVIWCKNLAGIAYLDNNTWVQIMSQINANSPMVIHKTNIVALLQTEMALVISKQKVDTLVSPSFCHGFTSNESKLISKTDAKEIVGISSQGMYKFKPSWLDGNFYDEVSTGRLSAGVSPTGDLFSNPNFKDPFQGFKADGKKAIFAANLWINATATNGEKLNMAQQYRLSGSDHFSGPISNVYDSAYLAKYTHVWKVTQTDINTHLQNFSNPNYIAPFGIKNWPGNGDVSKGEAEFLAPFIDENFNGIYEPEFGDYPDIRGDEAVFFMYNDVRGLKTESASKALGLEIHGMLYAYDSVQSEALHNSIFLNYKIINRSNNDYSDFKTGFWNDYDIGFPNDDLIGSDSVNRIAYAYNGDVFDEGPLGFGAFPPAIGQVALSDSLDGAMYYLNDFSPAKGNPTTNAEFSLFLNNQWKDGLPLVLENPSGPGSVLNGDGYDATGTSAPTKWAYNDAANWYHYSGTSDDFRSISYTNSGMLTAGSEVCIDFAMVYGRDSSSTNLLASVNKMKSHVSDLRQFYMNQNFGCLGASMSVVEIENKSQLKTFPNPVGKSLLLTIATHQRLTKVELISITGQMVELEINETGQDYQVRIPNSCSSGLYILKVYTKNNEVFINKISVLD